MPSNIPRMRELMDDPVFRAYMKRVPPGQPAFNTNPAWRLWVETPSHKWLTRVYPSYREVWPVWTGRFRAGDDPTITSRRVFYAPPGEWYKVKVRLDKPRVNSANGQVTTHRIETRWRQTWFYNASDLHWCGRCRRPSYWMPLFENHHALRILPAVTEDDNYRCTICGIRWIAQPDISQMVKMEVPS